MRYLRLIGRGLWTVLRVSHVLVFGSIGLLILIALIASLFTDREVDIGGKSVLSVTLDGVVVEERTEIDPATLLLDGNNIPQEILLGDLLKALDQASRDDRIKLVELQLSGMLLAGPAALHQIGDAVAAVSAAGKPVIAHGDIITQGQYLIAAQADEVYLNPSGLLQITGYASYPLYFAEALEKLKVNVNVFRVGSFKSAVEPFIRDDMSDEAKLQTGEFLNSLWRHYRRAISDGRGEKGAVLSPDLSDIVDKLRAAGGDLAAMALAENLVDGLRTRLDMAALLAERLDIDSAKLNEHRVGLRQYVASLKDIQPKSPNKVAVIHAVGQIMDGEQPAGTIGGDSLSALIDRARLEPQVKAIVLRIDSPGGSALASEVVRQSVLAAKAAGKPVVASMGSVAASGGYWIAANADEIWAAPTTITGSIGVFGLFPTLEDSLDEIGVRADGVGTTALAGQFGLTRPLNEPARAVLQMTVDNVYDDFLSLVAKGRGMTKAEIDRLAQGRVWTGEAALQINLVDALGDLDDAVKAAARRAGLEDGQYAAVTLAKPLSTEAQLLRQLLNGAVQTLGWPPASGQWATLRTAMQALAWPLRLNDPRGVYALCTACLAAGAAGAP